MHVTKEPFDEESEVRVLEKVVDVTGIEPVTPCLQSGEPNLLKLAGADATR